MTSPPPPKSKFTELLDTTSANSTYNSALNVSLEDILAETARRRSSSGSDSNPRSVDNSPTSPTMPTATMAAADTSAKGRLRRISLMGKHR